MFSQKTSLDPSDRKTNKNCYAGPLLKKELTSINMIIKDRKEPITCILGGSKISTKNKNY